MAGTVTFPGIWRERKDVGPLGGTWVMDGKSIRGINGSTIYTRNLQRYDHFDQIAITGDKTLVTDANCTAWAITAAKGGTIQGAVNTTTGNVASISFGELVYEADQGGLYFEARVNLSAITTFRAFFGLVDAKSYATTVIPFSISATTVTSNVTGDGIGWLFDTAATSVTWNPVAAKATVANTLSFNGPAPVAATFDILQIAVDTLGNAEFFVNDQFKGSLANALTATVRLCPMFSLQCVGAANRNANADYVFASQGF